MKSNIKNLRQQTDQIKNTEPVAAFEYKADGKSHFNVFTTVRGVREKHRVIMWQDADGAGFAKCRCLANSRFNLKCIHIQTAINSLEKHGKNVSSDLMGMFEELPESVKEDVLMIVRAMHTKYGFSK